MTRGTGWLLTISTLIVSATIFLLTPGPDSALAATPSPPVFEDAFWATWGDGAAELAGYELTYPRYGELRDGTAVTIFVTEPFAESDRVKAEDPARPESDRFPVMKLNLIQDFATGVYDYNLMTSVFVALVERNGLPAGAATKVSFSSQEWCGHVYAQALFDRDAVRFDSHSYFDGEADRRSRLERPPGGLSEDALLVWARGLAAPILQPGETRRARLLTSLERARLRHVEPRWHEATLSRSAEPLRVEVPAGTFEVDRLIVAVQRGRDVRTYPPRAADGAATPRAWTFDVERDSPRRVVRWEGPDGYEARLLASKRLRYWAMSGSGQQRALEEIGLRSRPPRTP